MHKAAPNAIETKNGKGDSATKWKGCSCLRTLLAAVFNEFQSITEVLALLNNKLIKFNMIELRRNRTYTSRVILSFLPLNY
jgi:hypothetical protein